MIALSEIKFPNLREGLPVISTLTGRRGVITALYSNKFGDEDEVEITWKPFNDSYETNSISFHKQLNSVLIDDVESLFRVINDTSKTVKQARNETAVMMHVMEEVGELALELAIHNGTSYKTAGDDGVIGEAVDSIICLMDLIYCHNPDITEEELVAIAIKKCQKWRNKAEG